MGFFDDVKNAFTGDDVEDVNADTSMGSGDVDRDGDADLKDFAEDKIDAMADGPGGNEVFDGDNADSEAPGESMGDRVEDDFAAAKDSASDSLDDAQDWAGDKVDDAQDSMGDGADAADDKWEDAKDAVGDKVDDVKDWTEDKVEDAKEEWHDATN